MNFIIYLFIGFLQRYFYIEPFPSSEIIFQDFY